MNIACTACSARYGVADDKLIGKRVRITCKRCGTVLIVDGNTNPPTVSASTSIAPSPPGTTPPPAEARPVAEPPFTVLFADGRQEQADVAQIVRFHRAGQLGTDSLVWRDGMSDWVDPWDVEDIAAAFKRMGYSRPVPPPAPPPEAQAPLREEFDEEATQIVDSNPQHVAPAYDDGGDTNVVSPARLAAPAATAGRHAASQRTTEEDDDPTRVGPLDRPSTQITTAAREAQRARRVSTQPPRETRPSEPARAAQATQARESRPSTRARAARAAEAAREDLFARQAHAGSEEEARAQAAAAPPDDYDAPRLTGARNESSVLFSLDSLLKQEQKKQERPGRVTRRDESLLVDTGSSLPAGGGIAPALAAPDFTAPITAPPPAPTSLHPYGDDERGRSSRGWLYVLVLVAFGGAGVLGWRTGALRELLLKAAGVPPAATSTATSASSATPSAAASETANNAVPSTSASAAAAPSASAAASAVASAASNAKTPATAATHALAHTATHEAATHETATHEAPEHEAATHEAPEHEAAAPASTGASTPFDTAAAKEALTTTSGNATSCKEMGGPVGNGKVSITFAPSGRPTSVAVTGDLAGTTVGSCVARLFRTVRVPAFSGDPVTVAKSFSIQ